MPHIFISYAKKDTRALAEALFAALNALPGISAWMDMSLEADSSWAGQIQYEIDRCDYIVVLLSQDVNRAATAAQRRSFVLNEIDYAQQENKAILPVMVQPTKMPVQLAGIQYIDLTNRPNDSAPIVERVRQRFKLAAVTEPVLVAKEERQQRSQTPLIIGAVGVLVLIALVAAFVLPALNPPTLTPTLATPNPTPTDALTVVDSGTPTLSSVEQLQTAQMRLTQSASTQAAADLTATQDNILGANATVTAQQIIATEAAAQATLLALSWTPTPKFTPTSTPTPTPDPLQAALEAARTFRGSNAAWQAFYPDGFQHTFEDGVPMVLVPAGSFTIGANPQSDDERNGGVITFDEPFWLDLTEVTQADFERLGGVKGNANEFDGDLRPVEGITWFEARDFCAQRRALTNADVRLPTEAEWEYGARGPAEWDYSWGERWNENNLVWNRSSEQGTAIVGSIPAGRSWVGAQDMSGNVWEWVSSLYLPYDSAEDREADTRDRTGVLRVLRGGSWYDGTESSPRAGNRVRDYPDAILPGAGFRCARST